MSGRMQMSGHGNRYLMGWGLENSVVTGRSRSMRRKFGRFSRAEWPRRVISTRLRVVRTASRWKMLLTVDSGDFLVIRACLFLEFVEYDCMKMGRDFFTYRMNEEKKLNNDNKCDTLQTSTKPRKINVRAVDFVVKLLSKYVWLFIFYILLSFKLFIAQ